MKKNVLFVFLLLMVTTSLQAQLNQEKLSQALNSFCKDSQMLKANVSFCMMDIQDGKILFEKKSTLPLPPASTIKTFTTAAALHYLGANYQYQTKISFKGIVKDKKALGEIIIYASGDPSLGSDRYETTKPVFIFSKLEEALQKKGIKEFNGKITWVNKIFTDTPCNRNWLEEDYGNYYGAGVYNFNWKENRFDIKISHVNHQFIVTENSGGYNNDKDFKLELQPKKGAGTEEAFAYVINNSSAKYAIRGYLSPEGEPQSMGLASTQPDQDFIKDLLTYFKTKISINYASIDIPVQEETLLTISSPPLSELVYGCNQKSLNLYAESFCKSIGYFKSSQGNWPAGLNAMYQFAQTMKVDSGQINLLDGSGLSPGNQITTEAMTKLLQAYTRQPWFTYFEKSLPLINNISMKSGYIGGTRSYAGYMKLVDGRTVSFAFIVNQFEGKPRLIKEKMFKVLDVLK